MSRWVIEALGTEEASTVEVEWDTWNIGIVEGDRFRAVYSCFTEADALRLKAALEWYDALEQGIVKGAAAPCRKKPVRPARKPAPKRK